jgi:hypothetical protein
MRYRFFQTRRLWRSAVCAVANLFVATTFYQFFNHTQEHNQSMAYNYSFLYWRRSPRGMVKFGITHLPWERLRMQQQGTDEVIQFDHLWMIRESSDYWFIKQIEEKLKAYYSDHCLYKKTKRAGHTEWFSDIDADDFYIKLDCIQSALNWKTLQGEVVKIHMDQPYRATKSSECPFGSPSNSRHQTVPINQWAAKFWLKLNPDKRTTT